MVDNVYSDPNIIAMKSVYDKALYKLVTANLPVTINLENRRLQGMSPTITQNASKETSLDITIIIKDAYPGEHGYIYRAVVFAGEELLFSEVIKHYELPILLANQQEK